MLDLKPIYGSYSPDDCQFLLTPIETEFLSIEEKERRIQTGTAHYSEMIHREPAPSDTYLDMFETLCERYAHRMAGEVRLLARELVAEYGPSERPLTLVSLVRAGTPAGALLRRAITEYEGQPCHHYSISIIRDRGIDAAALDYLLDTAGVDPQRLIFVDAWTAKGVITRELRHDMARYNTARKAKGKSLIATRLAVISDIGGTADYAATCEDYAIPSGVLNATVSGLVSRSVLNEQIPEGAFHGCVVYDELAEQDHSQAFIERIAAQFPAVDLDALPGLQESSRHRQQALMKEMLTQIQQDYAIEDINHVKPGVAEATRVMLRRVPALLIVCDANHADVAHLLRLAEEKSVPVVEDSRMPFHACSLIKVMAQQEVV
ncbi:cysteine protease StiP family protein [Halomonas sp. I5-271120]|uniref:cysteine protease StiP family protein n=1 Tax=Halomonas sp. I5-271120 TaxID=3061632 RepID=UPI002714B442|nr:cysteine protease StiP family protein [Halomonas sp. I5-271120]